MTRDLAPAVEALAARVGVRIQRGRHPGDPVFDWSFHVGENDRLADMHIVGPGVVYVRPDARVSDDVPPWAVLLHEVGHAATGSPDESLVAGWTDAAAREIGGLAALRVMRAYDRMTIDTLPATNRRRAVRAGVLDAAGRVVWP